MDGATLKLDSVPEGFALKTDAGIGTITSVTRTPQGGIRVTGRPTRSGVFVYQHPDGSVTREYRSPEEISKLDSLSTLDAAPITDNHPYRHGGTVTPENFSLLSKGHVSAPKWDSESRWVEATLYIQDAALIRKVDSKESCELSCGVLSRDILRPGVTPEGESYDILNTELRYNHLAVVPKARAGSGARIKLDALGLPAQTETKKESPIMLTIKIDGIDYPLATEADQKAASAAMSRWATKLDAESTALKSSLEGLKAKLDAATSELTTAKADAVAAKDPKRLEAAIEARLALRETAREILGKDEAAKLDSDDAIRAAVIAKAYPGLKLDGKSPDYVQGLFDSAVTKTKADSGAGEVIAALSPTGTVAVKTDAAPALSGFAKMQADNAEAWRQPLSFTKGS